MQHWEVIGASRSTGEDRRVTIHAANEQQAIDWATANDLLVSSIRQVPVERPHRAGAGRTAVRGRRAGESRIVPAFDQYLTPRWLVFLWYICVLDGVLFAIASIALALEYWPGDELTFGERAAIAGTGLLLATLHVVVGRLVLEGVAVLFDVLATLRDIRADLRERA